MGPRGLRGLEHDGWSSTDGITWTQVTAGAAFSPRMDFRAAVVDGTLYVIGGAIDSVYNGSDEVWASTDGASWRRGHRTVISF